MSLSNQQSGTKIASGGVFVVSLRDESPADSLHWSVKVEFVSVLFHVPNTSATFQRFLLCTSCRLDTTTLSL